MAEEKKDQAADKRKVILISVGAGLGTLALGFLTWAAIFSSQFATFQEDQYHISIKYPKDWNAIKGYEGTVVAFISPKEDSLDTFPESLNISVAVPSQATQTLDQYTQLAIKQMNAVFQKDIALMESKPITYAGFPAYLYVIKASGPTGLILKFIWFLKDGKAYTITCAAQVLRYEKYAAKFDEMLRSFSIPTF